MPGEGTRRAVPWRGLPLGVGQFPMTQASRLLLSATARVQEQLQDHPRAGTEEVTEEFLATAGWFQRS